MISSLNRRKNKFRIMNVEDIFIKVKLAMFRRSISPCFTVKLMGSNPITVSRLHQWAAAPRLKKMCRVVSISK